MKYTAEQYEKEAEAWEAWNRDHPTDQCLTTPPMLREAAKMVREREQAQPVSVPEVAEWGDLPDIASSTEFIRQCRLQWERFIADHQGSMWRRARAKARKRAAHFYAAEQAMEATAQPVSVPGLHPKTAELVERRERQS